MGQNLKVADLTTNQTIYVEDQHQREHLQVMARLDHRISEVSNQMLQASVSAQQGDSYSIMMILLSLILIIK
jgi:hypothetical protein